MSFKCTFNVRRNERWVPVASKGKFVLYHTKQKKNDSFYIYYLLAWYYRENQKPYRNTLRNLGTLTDEEVHHYKIAVDFLNKDPNTLLCNIDEVIVENSQEYLPCAIGNYFWDFWELSEIIDNDSGNKNIATSDIAKILTIIRWVQTCSKSMTSQLYSDTCLPQLTGVNPSSYNPTRIYRELENIESTREILGQHIFKTALQKGYTKGKVLFYDLSSANITGIRCVMAKWGHCKDGFRTHVVLLLVITPEGYPVYWELLDGNTADAKTIEPLIEKLEKTLGKIESVLCFDRGMVSDENLSLFENRNQPIKFITALDGDQIQYFKTFVNLKLLNDVKELNLKEQAAQIKEKLLDGGFAFIRDNLFCKELCLSESQENEIEKQTKKLGLKKRRYFLAFNPQLAYLTQKHRKERVDEFRDWISDYNEELAKVLIDKRTDVVLKAIAENMKKNRIANVDIQYELIPYEVENKNEKGVLKKSTTFKVVIKDIPDSAYAKAQEYDGIWVLVTNIKKDDDADFFSQTNFNSYFDIYRLKNNIEESFKILSQFVGVEPFYLYKTKHIKAHFTICVLSYLLDMTIINKIRAIDSFDNMSLERLFYILRKCKRDTIKISKGSSISKISQVTDKQKEILDILGCKHLITKNYLSKKNIVTIN